MKRKLDVKGRRIDLVENTGIETVMRALYGKGKLDVVHVGKMKPYNDNNDKNDRKRIRYFERER